MEHAEKSAATNVSELARQVDCFTESEFAALAGVKLTTLSAWRKRGQGPDYMLLGCAYLYSCQAVAEYLKTRVRERNPDASAKSAL